MTQLELDFNSPLPEPHTHTIVIDFEEYVLGLDLRTDNDSRFYNRNKGVITQFSRIKWDLNAVVRHAISQPVLHNEWYEEDSYIKDDFHFINFTANLAAFDISDAADPISMSRDDWQDLYSKLNEYLAAGFDHDALPQVHAHIDILKLVHSVVGDILPNAD